jgi:hypothetical protein
LTYTCILIYEQTVTWVEEYKIYNKLYVMVFKYELDFFYKNLLITNSFKK